MKVICDECKKEFEIDLQTEIAKDNIEKNFFVCPNCDKEYIAFCTNQSVRKNQASIRMLYRDLRVAKTKKQNDKIKSKIKELEIVIKNEMDNLKGLIITSTD
ncbi:hypothetical protein [Bacillus sp. MRMR6]|uniref:hypothetical protein n=1 Tax=Bacillus sp. MRMR6 TaxID=1928617 RepID=UPI000951B0E0|nr:hypothetical protein [Bacillus sp. MRMR6]OLS39128.1 hypothetical protein BTR25_13430 [Bacillus sp. MRMR6]